MVLALTWFFGLGAFILAGMGVIVYFEGESKKHE